MTSDRNQTLEALLALLRQFDPERLTSEIVKLGEEWADKEAAADSFEESRKSVLASVLLDYQSATPSNVDGKPSRGMPISQAEHRALCDPRYETHIELMVAARKQANVARVRYDMGKMKLELQRSQLATVRQEMRMVPMN